MGLLGLSTHSVSEVAVCTTRFLRFLEEGPTRSSTQSDRLENDFRIENVVCSEREIHLDNIDVIYIGVAVVPVSLDQVPPIRRARER